MKMISKVNLYVKAFGLSTKKTYYSVKGIPSFMKNYLEFNQQLKHSDKKFKITSFYPCLDDRYDYAGRLLGHYFYQDLFVANRIFFNKPEKHVDVGSRIDGFISHLASFRSLEVFDIRNVKDEIPNVKFIRADLMSDDFNLENYCDSVSCLHVIEHFGLGRYNDPIDINGHVKGLNNLFKLLKIGGKFYFSVPIGKQRIEFNAHRVFSIGYILELLNGKYNIDYFSYIDDQNKLHPNVKLTEDEIANNLNCTWGCGIWELTKL